MKLKRAPGSGLQKREFPIQLKAAETAGRFGGYGSVFGNVDSYGEIVAPGAFRQSLHDLAIKGRRVPILYQHDRSEPMGVFDEVEEDENGLRVAGTLLVDDVPRARSAWANMVVGSLTGLSIGFYVREYELRDDVIVLTALDLQEVSIVTFPANDAARIDSIKARIAGGLMPTKSDLERILREAGFSRTQATVIANRGLNPLLAGAETGATDWGEAIKAARDFALPTIR